VAYFNALRYSSRERKTLRISSDRIAVYPPGIRTGCLSITKLDLLGPLKGVRAGTMNEISRSETQGIYP